MSFDIKLFSEKFKRLLELLEFSELEFSQKSKIPLTRVNELVEGFVEPTGDEVLIISDILKVDYYFLISNESATQIEKTEVFYRNNKAIISKEDKRVISETLQLATFYKYLDDSNTKYKQKFTPQITKQLHVDQGVEVALQLRKYFHISDRQKGVNPFQLARKLGIQVFRRKLSNSSISGIHVSSKDSGKVIIINYNDDIYRQNFTLLHELAHSIFDVQNNYRLSLEGENNDKDLKYVEMRANRFASTFLIPPTLANAINDKFQTDDDFIKLANEFHINPIALAFVLKSNKLINYNTVSHLKKLKIPRNMKNDPELKGLSDNSIQRVITLQERGISINYFRKCMKAYLNDQITFARFSEILSLTDIELNIYLDIMGVKKYA